MLAEDPETARKDQVTAQTPCGPDIAGELCEVVTKYEDAGYDHVSFHQVGPDQDGFFRFWERELGPELARPDRSVDTRL